MISINLLPWREKKRKCEQQQWLCYLLVGFSVAVLVMFFLHYQARSWVDMASHRNERLHEELTQLEPQIKAIHEMKILRKSRLTKIAMLEQLQLLRIRPPKLLSELIAMLPSGL